ncbi:MAG: glycosyltransferase family 9 protein [Burkholderiales bacterium]|nr:glycosyltransferase family 9 protein [Burkholderiales bacterium]
MRERLLHGALRAAKSLDARRPDPAELGTAAIARILAVSSTALGDTLLSTPALRSLREGYPGARISFLVHSDLAAMFRAHPRIDELIPYHGGWRRFLRLALALRARRFDLACILHGNEPQATPLAYLSGARFLFKLPNTSRSRFLLANAQPVRDGSEFAHGVDERLETARLAGGTRTDRRMELPVGEDSRRALAAMLRARGIAAGRPLVALQAGASTRSRRWAPSRHAELGRRLLAARERLHLVLTGSSSERALAADIAAAIGSPRVWNAAGEVPIEHLPALLERCDALVSGDTGPMHLALAVGTPVVALFAVSDARRSGPACDLERHRVIQKWRTCDPCLSKRCPYNEPVCMKNIAVDEVLAAANAVLDEARGTALSAVLDRGATGRSG